MSKMGLDCGLMETGCGYCHSGAMIGMFHQNGDRTVNLLGKHHPRQPVGPGHRPERQEEAGFLACFRRMAVRTAKEEDERRRALIEMALEEMSEIIASERLATFIEDDAEGRFGRGAGEKGRF